MKTVEAVILALGFRTSFKSYDTGTIMHILEHKMQ